MANGWSLIVGLIICAAIAVACYILSPKGENQTIWRSSLVLTVASCYLMWALTLLAQLHPLIAPKSDTMRPEGAEASKMMAF